MFPGIMWIPIVDLRLCKGCGECAQVCPDNAIEIVDKKSIIDYNECTCCGVCDRVCPIGALEIKNPTMPPILEKGVQLETLKDEVKRLKQKLREMRKTMPL
ncbi:MAG: 4Fe-4S binding protein [Methanophagales archaeon]|nr:4Fe-4S binding protein [Methanophagales archaeon]